MGQAIDVVKRGGKRASEQFSRDKLHASIYAACLSVRSLDGHASDTADHVCNIVLSWTDNKPEITSADIRQQVNDYMYSVMQAEPLDASLLQYDDYEGW